MGFIPVTLRNTPIEANLVSEAVRREIIELKKSISSGVRVSPADEKPMPLENKIVGSGVTKTRVGGIEVLQVSGGVAYADYTKDNFNSGMAGSFSIDIPNIDSAITTTSLVAIECAHTFGATAPADMNELTSYGVVPNPAYPPDLIAGRWYPNGFTFYFDLSNLNAGRLLKIVYLKGGATTAVDNKVLSVRVRLWYR